jgi:predicted Zn-dependent protease
MHIDEITNSRESSSQLENERLTHGNARTFLLESLTCAIAASLARKGELEQAESLLHPFSSEVTPGAEVIDLLAKVYAQQGKLDEAQALWLQLIQKEPSNPHFFKALQECNNLKSKRSPHFFWRYLSILILMVTIVFNMINKATCSSRKELFLSYREKTNRQLY